jgi:nucleoside-diphosphate-sugar epimerase
MTKLLITGSSGFVGKNLINYFFEYHKEYLIQRYNRYNYKQNFINNDVVIHLAGKAHDLKKTTSPNEYYEVNTELTKKIFDDFLESETSVFIVLSSVKAVADKLNLELTEEFKPEPITHYGKSKLLAEQYILSKEIAKDKRVYILRPCMIHGPGNKGNLNLLYKIVRKGLPWPLGSFNNKRSFCSIENLCFVINELIERKDISSGVYNISDNEPISTNDLIQLIANTQNKKPLIFNIPKSIILLIAKFGNILHLPLNTERLQKLTETYTVSNKKLLSALGKELPISSKEGLIQTIQSFNH